MCKVKAKFQKNKIVGDFFSIFINFGVNIC